ncbi:serine/threonine-protein kinase ULK1 isoform X2 [Brachyhypopomus gauderio]|uniref:serine/threonine-protein kinase ULK1 isoform X2 n=1 Tax=Brachyhypopomus gauderio TaxID=698409 RepID=UPI004042A34A
MESVGRFEFSRKELIGHGAFAVVFKGRHREKYDWEVAIKCINKKNLAKSQTLLGKEIKILKELKHENIVALHDFQETASSVYLVMEYCNGGDLADYLHSKGSLSEDTIRVFLQQIAGAMRVLQAKGIIHRDLKPQNILLSHPAGRKSQSNTTCIKIADFGFARHLQNNMMAATLCGSPMYMAPEVIMSQTYDAKADLWSIGTIVFQCLTGKAPFQASSPQDLRLFYEKNKNLSPNIPRETSGHLRHLLLGLLQRNHKDRMDFDEFFRHPFLEASATMKKSVPVTLTCLPGSASASSCSSSSTSHLASPPSLGEIQQTRAKVTTSPTQDSPQDSGAGGVCSSSSKNSSCDTDDFVMVPPHFPSEHASEVASGKVLQDSLMYSGCSFLVSGGQTKSPPRSPSCSGCAGPAAGTAEYSASNYGNYGQSVPIPVPTQIHNYQRMEQNLHSPRQDGSPRCTPTHRCSSVSPLAPGRSGPPSPHAGCGALQSHRLSVGGAKPFQLSPHALQFPEAKSRPQQPGLRSRLHSAPCLLEAAGGCKQTIRKQHSDPVSGPQGGMVALRPLHSSPRLSDLIQRRPLPTILGSPSRAMPPFEFPKPPSSPNVLTLLTQQARAVPSAAGRPSLGGEGGRPASSQLDQARAFGRSQSAGRLSDVLLMAAFGGQLGDCGSSENLHTAVDITVPPGGGTVVVGSGSPVRVLFTVGSPPSGSTPPLASRSRKFSVGSPTSISPIGSLTSRYPQPGMCLDAYEGPLSPRYGLSEPINSLEGAVTFEPPELPEETLMEQEHTETLRHLRFMLDFARCMVEVSRTRGGEVERAGLSSTCLHHQSVVADQISSLSREWSYAEQLVLYMKTAELLSSALHTAMEGIKLGKVYPSATVKQGKVYPSATVKQGKVYPSATVKQGKVYPSATVKQGKVYPSATVKQGKVYPSATVKQGKVYPSATVKQGKVYPSATVKQGKVYPSATVKQGKVYPSATVKQGKVYPSATVKQGKVYPSATVKQGKVYPSATVKQGKVYPSATVKQGKVYPSATVKQVVRRLNELYKSCVMACRSLSARLEHFFSRKQRLMDHITRITAERLIFTHTVQMVQAAALDEMFHQGEASVQRYHKALLLMEGLTLLLTERDDLISVGKCKQCIERRLAALQAGVCV